LNAETTAASQSALRDACNEYESKFGVKIVVDSTPISGGYAKSMAAINAGAPYDIATAGHCAHLAIRDGGSHRAVDGSCQKIFVGKQEPGHIREKIGSIPMTTIW
jgi:hypothetical protein